MHYILNVHYRFLKYESAKHLFPLRHSEVEVQSSIKWKYSLKKVLQNHPEVQWLSWCTCYCQAFGLKVYTQWWKDKAQWKVLDLQIIAAIADDLMHTKVPAHCSADVCVQKRDWKGLLRHCFLTQASVPQILTHSDHHNSNVDPWTCVPCVPDH